MTIDFILKISSNHIGLSVMNSMEINEEKALLFMFFVQN